MTQEYYIKLGYDPKLIDFVKNISGYIILLVCAFMFNHYNLKFDTFFSALYDIILYFILYSHLFLKNESDFGTTTEKIAFALMAESIMISYNKFYYTKTNWFFYTRKIEVSIQPNMVSIIIALSYYFSLVVRNNLRMADRPKDLILNLANLLFFSTLISVFVSNEYLYIPFYQETNITAQTFCLFLSLSFWICIKSINKLIYPIMAFLSMCRLGEVNKAMGNIGICYLLCAYLSLILQISSWNKSGNMMNNFTNELSNDFFYHQETPSIDVNFYNNYSSNSNFSEELEKKIKFKIRKEKTKALVLCEGERHQILKLKNGKNINIIIKSLDQTENTININDAEKISKLKQRLRIVYEKYRKHTLLLIYKGKNLEDDKYISNYGIKNGSVIVPLLKPNKN